jgi:hypothetical protein
MQQAIPSAWMLAFGLAPDPQRVRQDETSSIMSGME